MQLKNMQPHIFYALAYTDGVGGDLSTPANREATV